MGSLVSFVMLRLQLCPTSLVPIPSSVWQLEWGVSHNASAMVPRLTAGLESPPQRRGALALPSTPCLPPLPQLRPHPTEKTTHFVSHEHEMTVTKTLQEEEVRLRAG